MARKPKSTERAKALINPKTDLVRRVLGYDCIPPITAGELLQTSGATASALARAAALKITARPPDTSQPLSAASINPSSRPVLAASTIKSAHDMGLMVRAARDAQNFTQQEFADLAGVGRRFLSELENGKATLEFDKIMRVAAAAGIDLFARKR